MLSVHLPVLVSGRENCGLVTAHQMFVNVHVCIRVEAVLAGMDREGRFRRAPCGLRLRHIRSFTAQYEERIESVVTWA